MFYRNVFGVSNPWRELERIQHEMNRLFTDPNRPTSRNYPAINGWIKDNTVIVTAELPGYAPEDIDISVVDQTLTIRGERKPCELKEGETFHRQERRCGKFQREVQLPFGINADKVEANFDNGVLSITLPRAEADMPRKISIKSE